MASATDNIISIFRGNPGAKTVNIQAQDGTPYPMYAGDKLVFALKKNVLDTAELLHKEYTTKKITFDAADTLALPFGKYLYDVTLITADGTPHTIIGATDFNILEVVRNG